MKAIKSLSGLELEDLPFLPAMGDLIFNDLCLIKALDITNVTFERVIPLAKYTRNLPPQIYNLCMKILLNERSLRISIQCNDVIY